MSTKQLYEKTSEGMKEVSPLVAIEDIYSKLSDTPLESLVSLYNHVKCEWKGSVADTRRTVPLFLRRSGLFITYNNGTKYVTEFFSAGSDQITTEGWVKDTNWTSVPDEDYISAGVKPGVGSITYEQLNDNLKQLFREKVNVTNYPDDEDIASVDNMLKLKDREANAANFQSKGYVILRKNLRLVNGVIKNILTQDIINKPNTIYEIKYDFDLNGATLEINDECVLKFHGGKLKNGSIKGNNTQIEATPSLIFNNVTFSGRWRIYNYYPEWFISDFSDCTNGIQQAIDFASINNGGKIVFQSRQYNVKSIHTGIKTNLIGSGIGATIIKQIEGLKDTHCIDIPNTSAGIRIENMTILGNQEAGNNGISKAQIIDGGENHEYIYTELRSWDKIQAYRWCVIRNVAVYKFDKGIYLANHFFCCYIEKVICSDNLQYGIHFACTDSSILNTFLNHNGVHGLYLEGSNNKIIGLKSIFNGYKKQTWNAAYLVLGSKNQLIGCESQDNYCTGFYVDGVRNTFIGCISNTDGYKPADNYVYEKDPSVRNFAFLLNSAKGENSFSSCIATNYLNKPIPERFLFDASDPSNSFEGIDIILDKDSYEGYNMDRKDSNLYMNNTEVHDYLIKEKYKNKFFAPVAESPAYINFNNNIQLAGIDILVDFVIDQSTLTGSNRLFTIGNIEIVVSKGDAEDYIVAFINNENYCVLSSIGTYNRNRERRLLLTITENKIVLKGFFHDGNGMKLQVSEHNYSYSETVSSIKLNSHECLNLRRFLLFYGRVDCKYLIPAIPLNNIYERAVIKLDANTYSIPKTIGISNEKPKNVSVGFIYKDTTLNKLILWEGTKWVNLDGTELI